MAKPSFAGIGQVKANVDMLSSPARNMVVENPPVVVAPRPPRGDMNNRGRWEYYRRNRDRGYAFPYTDNNYYAQPWPYSYYPYTYPYADYGASTTVGGYGYTYPMSTIGVMRLPAAAVRYDKATDSYVYGYGNPMGPPLSAPMMAEPAPTQAPAPAAPMVPETPTIIDRARYSLQVNMPDQAVTELRDYLRQDENDWAAQRLLGMALLRQKRFDDGVACIAQAYRMKPTLADQVMYGNDLGLSPEALRSLVLSAVTYANRVDTSSAWLTVSVLMQAEGRKDVARQMIDKAEKKGLEPEVVAAMDSALGSATRP